MAFLTPDKTVSALFGLKIKQKIIPDTLKAEKTIAKWCKKGQPMKPCKLLNDGTGKPKGITVHNTADIKEASGTNDAEQYARSTYNGNMSGVVVHFYVYNNEIWQLLDETERGWHATDGSSRRKSQRSDGSKIGGNLDTIAIECIGNSKLSEETTAKLVAYLCYKHGLDPETDVYQHNYFYPSKDCPMYIRPHWGSFLEAVNYYYGLRPTSEPVKLDKSFFLVRVIDPALNIRKGPSTLYGKVGVIKDNGTYTIVKTNKAGTWGLLKSYADKENGWICIKNKYVERVSF